MVMCVLIKLCGLLSIHSWYPIKTQQILSHLLNPFKNIVLCKRSFFCLVECSEY
ncbi:hypothetical protein CRENPOLYSF1_200068 [Crenothrix polyspora]|uniref:Uncharacterized protein n=1 Tax=Crenothrix polyspora TaxID=360316 RepID=A0A1R4H639_9GAMM|nr:hypothetical protein CRENPOLYSF1_200068 [Crenothrix polyspora]